MSASLRRPLLACGACLVGLGAAVLSSTCFFPLTTHRIDRGEGSRVFQANCSGCHSLRADAPASYGPALTEIGAVAGKRLPGMTAEAYIFDSIVRPAAFKASASGEMSPDVAAGLSISDLRNVTAFLCSQGGKVDYQRVLALDPPQTKDAKPVRELSLASIEKGRRLFHDLKCSSCHALDDAPGAHLVAPSLSKIGVAGREHLRKAVLTPSAEIAPAYVSHMAVDEDGVMHQGPRLPSAPDEVRLICLNSQGGSEIRSFPAETLEPFEDGQITRKLTVSSMPSPPAGLPPADLESLLDFLQTLR
jgi:cytochrome c2